MDLKRQDVLIKIGFNDEEDFFETPKKTGPKLLKIISQGRRPCLGSCQLKATKKPGLRDPGRATVKRTAEAGSNDSISS